jgi:phage N-6-adenine-methyltransferase
VNQPMSVLTSQGTVEWYTPPHIIKRAQYMLGNIDLDPASNETAQAWINAETYYTADDCMSGLARPWFGRVWLNPPFDDTPAWVRRLGAAYAAEEVIEAVLLVNSAPGYVWWEELADTQPIVMLRERLRFVRPDGTPGGQAKKGQTIAYYGADVTRFVAIFQDLGRVVLPTR